MIVKIEGLLESIEGDSALIRLPMSADSGEGSPMGKAMSSSGAGGAMTYAIMLPAYAGARLGGAVGQHVTLHTLYTIESQGQGTTMFPRLLGFLSVADRLFFELFTTCKGIGHRKALRAMTLETSQIAAAIADRDVATLQSLPEIGRRTAETIVATLRGKVDRFLTVPGDQPTATDGGQRGEPAPLASGNRSLVRETLEVMMRLGENRVEALTWIDRVLTSSDDPPSDVEQLLAEVYRVKSSPS